jgi:NAD(P)H-dependent FMN reductase
MPALKILVIPGSIRTGSINARLAAVAVKELALLDVDVSLISLGDYPLPIYDGDLEAKSGVPANAVNPEADDRRASRRLHRQPGIQFVGAAALKNAIDWVTRVRDRNETFGQVFRERAFAIGAASDGKFGGLRVLMALRQILALAAARR